LNNYCYLDRRREGFTRWLASSVATDCEFEIESTKDVHTAVFFALLKNDVAAAIKIAMESGEHRLALILSSGLGVSQLIRDQLMMWEDSGALDHISPTLLRVYNLMSGELSTEMEFFRAGKVSKRASCSNTRRGNHMGLRTPWRGHYVVL